MNRAIDFDANARHALEDPGLRRAVGAATELFRSRRDVAFAEWPHADAVRDRAKAIRRHAVSRLDDLLAQLSARIEVRGGVVHRARDGAEACAIVLAIARDNAVRRVVKSKSMATEEIELNAALVAAGLDVVETDLGEFVVQLAGDRPSHLIAPIVHKSRADVAALFERKLGTAPDAPVDELTRAARVHLRGAFLGADMGITGANFAVAETGTIAIVENEGNARLTTTRPRVHVVVVGVEKVVARLSDLAVLLPALTRSATGQKLSAYMSLISGPRRPGEADGAASLHVVLLDNGRSAIATDAEMSESLECLRCAACLNACPVYRTTGGHAYGAVYSGPIGAVLTPQLVGLDAAADLPYASSLCGACLEVCPVRIDIPRMLLALRARVAGAAASGPADDPRPVRSRLPFTEIAALRLAARVAESPRAYHIASVLARAAWAVLGARVVRRIPGPLRRWAEARELPPFAPRTFRDRFRARARVHGGAR